jgi:DNA-binding LacI/PurR family transcriptional regulator
MPDKPRRHISLKDIARELNVSISTVSRALKDHPNIGPGIKAKVRRLAEEWGYRPNPLAMGLLRQNTRTIGVIVPDLVTHFFSSVISGIESYASNQGYYIIISSSNESYSKEKECIENLMNSRVEGMIICLSMETEDHSHFEDLHRKGVPLVFFDRVCLSDRVPVVTVNNREAAWNTTEHLIKTGCKRIAHIAGPPYLNISAERMEGYRQALKDHGLPIREDLLIHAKMNPEEATLATRNLLALPDPPDAIFGVNDTVAFAAMTEVKRQGYRIPGDIAIIGFTDEYHALIVDPPLTSIQHPTIEMGQAAARLMFGLLNGDSTPRLIELKTELVVRESSGKETRSQRT